jgi:hypothetical protein
MEVLQRRHTRTRFFWTSFTVFFRIHGCFNQGVINMLRSLGRRHTVWLCTEGPPKNGGQGSHAVLTTDLMDLLLARDPDGP